MAVISGDTALNVQIKESTVLVYLTPVMKFIIKEILNNKIIMYVKHVNTCSHYARVCSKANRTLVI